MSDRWQELFPQSPLLFPHLIDVHADQVLLSHLGEDDFRKASFLDQRIFTPELRRQLVPWPALSQLSLPEKPKPQYIFHIGHVGSTLISRLLGELDGILALREPQLLRNLSEISQIRNEPQSPWSPEQYEARLEESISWLSRSFHAEQRVMIKASSFVSELASELLHDNGHALFLYAPLERYLPTILAGEASIQETQAMAAARLLRLSKYLGEAPANLWELDLAKRIALSWMCEMVTLNLAEKNSPSSSINWVDFELFLEQPEDMLMALSLHFGYDLIPERAAELISGPIMSSYSKAPEHDYSPNLRQQLLQEASDKHADAIDEAMLWVEKLAKQFPLIEQAMQRT